MWRSSTNKDKIIAKTIGLFWNKNLKKLNFTHNCQPREIFQNLFPENRKNFDQVSVRGQLSCRRWPRGSVKISPLLVTSCVCVEPWNSEWNDSIMSRNNNGSNEGIHDTVSTLSKTRLPRLIAGDKAELFHFISLCLFFRRLNPAFLPSSQTFL